MINKEKILQLQARLEVATGSDKALGRDLLRALTGENDGTAAAADPTASVDSAIALIARARPGWRWHVGYGVDGLLPYASLRANDNGARFEAGAPTVPLALLRALMKALGRGRIAGRGEHGLTCAA